MPVGLRRFQFARGREAGGEPGRESLLLPPQHEFAEGREAGGEPGRGACCLGPSINLATSAGTEDAAGRGRLTATVPSHLTPEPHLDQAYRDLDESLDNAARLLPKRPQNAASFMREALNRAGLAVALGRDVADCRRAMAEALTLAVALYRADAGPDDEETRLTFRGHDVAIPNGRRGALSGAHWVWGWALARLLGDAAAMESLCAHDAEGNDGSLIRLFRERERGRPWEALHDRELGDAARRKSGLLESWLLLLDVFDRTGRGPLDAAELSNAVVRSLEAHRAYYADPDQRHHYHAAVAWIPLALCREAWDAGVAVSVDSPYLPLWLFAAP